MRFVNRTSLNSPDVSVSGLTRSRPPLLEVVELNTLFRDAVPGNPLLDREDQDKSNQVISVHGTGGIAPRDYTRGSSGGGGTNTLRHGLLLGLNDDDHHQYHNNSRGDSRYYQKTEFITTSAGSSDAGSPIELDSGGEIDDSMIPLKTKGDLLLGDGVQTTRLSVGADTNLLVADSTLSLGIAWVTPATVAATLDHGLLLGLDDGDHDAVYYTETELDGGQLDNRYFTEAEHLNVSAGAGDAGKPIKLDVDGHIDASMINDGDLDHGSLGGLGDDDHTQYLLADGTRALTGAWAANNDITGITKLEVDNLRMNLNTLENTDSLADLILVAASGRTVRLGNLFGPVEFQVTEVQITPPVDVDVIVKFQGTTNQGTLTYKEDEDEFRFSGSLFQDDVAVVDLSSTQTLTNKTLIAPTIGFFLNALHDHEDANGGGTLTLSSLTQVTEIFPHSLYIDDNAGNLWSGYHDGDGANSQKDYGVQTKASLAATKKIEMRFAVPGALPAGTAKLKAVALADVTSGTIVIEPKWNLVAADADPSSATMTTEGTTTVTWGTGDDDVYMVTKITLDAVSWTGGAGKTLVMDLYFDSTSTLSVVSTWQFSLIWE